MTIFTRPIIEINLNNIVKNYNYLNSLVGNAESAAVVKDDAYGIGAKEVAKILYDKAGCRTFFVAHGIEGERIRPLVPDAKIYVLQGVGEDSIDGFKSAKLIPVINSLQMYQFWNRNKVEGIEPAIQIETGLNRLGFREEDLKQLPKDDLNNFSLVLSHLACADNQVSFMNKQQLQEFNRLRDMFFPNTPCSLAASDGIFLGHEFSFNIVRLGAAMYGIKTTKENNPSILNTIKISAPILEIAEMTEGQYAGYDITYKAPSNRKIAIVSIGYGDGLPRSLSNHGKVFFETSNGRKEANIIGRVSMDNIICDITELEGLKLGDTAIIIDDQHNLDSFASDCSTIGYEIISRFGKNQRFIRKYIK